MARTYDPFSFSVNFNPISPISNTADGFIFSEITLKEEKPLPVAPPPPPPVAPPPPQPKSILAVRLEHLRANRARLQAAAASAAAEVKRIKGEEQAFVDKIRSIPMTSTDVPKTGSDRLAYIIKRRSGWLNTTTINVQYDHSNEDIQTILEQFSNALDKTLTSVTSTPDIIILHKTSDPKSGYILITPTGYTSFSIFCKTGCLSVLFVTFCVGMDFLITVTPTLITPNTLTVAAYKHFEPVSFIHEGQDVGLDVDLMNMYAAESSISSVVFNDIPDFNNIWNKPAENTADISIGGIGVTHERRVKDIEWTIPYFYVKRTMVYKKSMFPKGLTNIVDDLEIKRRSHSKLRVRGTDGSTGWRNAQIRRRHLPVIMDPGTNATNIKNLEDEKIVGFMRGSMVGKALVKTHSDFNYIKPWDTWGDANVAAAIAAGESGTSVPESMVLSDGEYFAFPCKEGTGVAEHLSIFLAKQLMGDTVNKLITTYELDEESSAPVSSVAVSAALPLSKDAADDIATKLATHSIGFQNAGSQCYKSAALQMFTHMSEFVSTVLQLKSKVVPIPALQTLLLELNKNPTTFDPETCDIEKADITKRLGCVAKVGTQQDAAQFIDQCIFQKLSTLYETIYTDNTNPDQVLLKHFLEQCATISNTSYYISEACLPEDKTGESQHEELFLYSVALNGTDISDILTKPMCEKLDKTLLSFPSATHRSYNINSSGLYFIMSLKRFDNKLNKLQQSININDMILIGTESIEYQLQGIIVHSGLTLRSGHYVYFWRTGDTTWKLISDSSVSDVTNTTTADGHIKIPSTYNTEQDGYIFLYKRTNPIDRYANLDEIIHRRLPEPPFSSSSSSSSSSSPAAPFSSSSSSPPVSTPVSPPVSSTPVSSAAAGAAGAAGAAAGGAGGPSPRPTSHAPSSSNPDAVAARAAAAAPPPPKLAAAAAPPPPKLAAAAAPPPPKLAAAAAAAAPPPAAAAAPPAFSSYPVYKITKPTGGFVTLQIIEQDITKIKVDVIVNAANEQMLGGSGIDGAIHKAAGPTLLEKCRALPILRSTVRCETGSAKLLKGRFANTLAAPNVIGAVGPRGTTEHRMRLLAGAYSESIKLAVKEGYKSIAFPSISTGIFGYPLEEAARVSLVAIRDAIDLYKATSLTHIYICIFGNSPQKNTEIIKTITDAANYLFSTKGGHRQTRSKRINQRKRTLKR